MFIENEILTYMILGEKKKSFKMYVDFMCTLFRKKMRRRKNIFT
jgi:hypothetical protein